MRVRRSEPSALLSVTSMHMPAMPVERNDNQTINKQSRYVADFNLHTEIAWACNSQTDLVMLVLISELTKVLNQNAALSKDCKY